MILIVIPLPIPNSSFLIGAPGAFLWNPFGVRNLLLFLPSVRIATLGFGVELLCSSFLHPRRP